MSLPSRIIVRAPNWLGDAVMALPALAAVRAHFTSAELAVCARSSIAPLFEHVTGVTEVLSLSNGQGWGQLTRRKNDVAILLPNSFRVALEAYMARIPERWGYGSDLRSPLLTRAIPKPVANGYLHQSEYYLALLRGLDIPVSHDALTKLWDSRLLSVPPTALAKADQLLVARGVRAGANIVGVAPGAAYGSAKRWPAERFAKMIARVHETMGAVCVLVGSASDRGSADEIARSKAVRHAQLVDLVGETDLATLLGILRRSVGFVSNDSGAMHLAAAVGVPVTALFGPTNEHVTAPLGSGHRLLKHDVWCRPCLLRECPIDHGCMRGIGVEEVSQSVVDQIESKSEIAD